MCAEGPSSEEQRTVLMADIVGSTSLYERLGDLRARELVRSGLEAMTGTVEKHGGRVVKSLGDGILACFDGEAAVAAALEITERVSALMLEARVGVHCGPVIDDGTDIFGDTVNTTARLASVARPSEVLLSKPVWVQLPDELRGGAHSLHSIGVKGKRDPVEVFSILKSSGEFCATLLDASGNSQQEAPCSCIELRLGEERLRLEGPGSLLVGRGPDCDLRVDHEQTSRTHLRVFYRAPAFMLEDTSSNGTTVVQESGAPVLIHRRETVLFGSGRIYPGSIPGSPGAVAIEYLVR